MPALSTNKANRIPILRLIELFSPLSKEALDATKKQVTLHGRITRIRESSKKLWFIDITQDGYRSQLILNQTCFEDLETFSKLKENLRRGDIIEASGLVTRTLTGELSVRVEELSNLTKCQVNLPDSLLDTENRMRHRHLDMITNTDFARTLKTRASIISQIRKYLDDRGFVEVETPVLSTTYGGANARPFQTRHISDLPLYLRIAPELSLKQLIVGGMSKVYELGKVFRNEGLDASHNPEFTSCELYQAFSNGDEMMTMTEDMLTSLGENLGSPMFLKIPFERIEIKNALEQFLGERLPIEEDPAIAKNILLEIAEKKSIGSINSKMTLPKIYDKLIEKYLEPLCEKPTFLMGHPMIMSPLAKARADNKFLADRFELFVSRTEIANGFSEQTDPDIQLEAFRQQAIDKANGDAEAQPLDEDYVQVLRAGLPPTGGCGIGIDRLVMLLTGKTHIRDPRYMPASPVEMVFSQLYKQAEDVPVILSVDFDFLTQTAKKHQFKRPEQIFKYSLELEEKVMREYEKRNPPAALKAKFDSVLKPTKPASPPQPVAKVQSPPPPAVEILAEFDQNSPPSPWDVATSSKDDLKELGESLQNTHLSLSEPKGPSEKGIEASSMYLPDETEENRTIFALAHDKAFEAGGNEMDALRGFFLFKDDKDKVLAYLDNYFELRELGFSQEEIDVALLGNRNDKEKALEALMSKS